MLKTLIATLFSLVAVVTAHAADATISLTPFVAYYGETNLEMKGPKVDSPMPVPNRVGSSSSDMGPGIAKICGPDAKAYYHQIGSSGGGSHGFTVVVGVCVKEQNGS